MNALNRNKFNPIKFEKFNGSFEVSKEVFDVLNICEDLVAWKMKDDEIVIFSKYNWDIFVEKIKMRIFLDEFEEQYNVKLDKSSVFEYDLDSKSNELNRWLQKHYNINIFYTRRGTDTIRSLFAFAQPVVLQKNKKIVISGQNRLRKFLEGKDFSVSFYF